MAQDGTQGYWRRRRLVVRRSFLFSVKRRRLIGMLVAVAAACGLAGVLPAVAGADPPLPTASFSFDPPAPLTGETVTFTSTSVPDPGREIVAEDWDLDGDGVFGDASGPSVTHAYAAAGTYVVSLQVTDDHDSTSSTSQEVVVADRPPNATFTATPNPALTNQDVTFDASDSIDPDGTIVKYEWDLDGDSENGFETDGGTSPTFTRSYAADGSLSVGLRVTDDNGAKTAVTNTLVINNRLPAASFTIAPNPALTGQAAGFDASASSDADGSISKYEWDLDGNTANGFELDSGTDPTVQRSYTDSGPVSIRLRVTDDDGASVEASKSLTINNRPPTATLGVSPNPALTGQTVLFDATGSSDPDGTIAQYKWDIDGNSANGFETDSGTDPTVTRSYGFARTLTARLQVIDDDGGSAIAQQTLTIDDRPPAASFTIDPNPASTGQTVNFDASDSTDSDGAIVKYEWDLDGNTANGFEVDTSASAQASRSYSTGGSISVRLRVTDNDSKTAVTTRALTISNQGPAASFTVSPNPAATGQTVNLNASGSSDPDGTITSYEWDLDGNGSFETDSGSDATIAHVYATAQTITVKLRVGDDNGKTALTTRSVTITNRAPTASFSISSNPALTGEAVTFDASGSSDPDGTIATYAWDLDDDGQFDDASGKTVQTSFPTAGSYPIGLRVSDNHGAGDDAAKTLAVEAAPTASFDFSPNPALIGQTVHFDATGSSDADGTIVKYEWDLDGNGSFEVSGSNPTPGKSYSAANPSIPVKLRVTDEDGNSTETSHVLSVNDRLVTASIGPLSPELPLTGDVVTFVGHAEATGFDNEIVDYDWDLDGDGLYETDTGATPGVTRSYPVPASITVRLQVSDKFGNVAFASRQLVVANRAPVASFGFAPGTPLVGDAVNFFSTSSDPDTPIVDQAWDLDGDGSFDDASGASVARAFSSPGSYTVGLRVTDSEGSSVVAARTVVVSVRPVAPRVVTSSPKASLLSPFPVVRISGTIKRRGTRLRRFSVVVPIGATLVVRCKGRGCPFRRLARTAQPEAKKGSQPGTKLIRIRRLERRVLRAGMVVRVFVTKQGTIGKFTEFKMKRRRPPVRVDRCLTPGGSSPVQCPVS
jgi:YD repeat-containing protein